MSAKYPGKLREHIAAGHIDVAYIAAYLFNIFKLLELVKLLRSPAPAFRQPARNS